MQILTSFFLLILWGGIASACFGPKLYLGTGSSAEEELLYALVSLYIKEKTGTETVQVPLDLQDPLGEIAAERVDMAFVSGEDRPAAVLLEIPGWPRLASGRRPLDDLQFTTVAPALNKLNRLLTPEHLTRLQQRQAAGTSAAAAARQLLREEGWI